MRSPSPFLIGLAMLFLVVALTSACSSSGQGSSRANSSMPIERVDIENLSASNAHDVIRRLRPRWLQHRGPTSLQDPTPQTAIVYVDGTRLGDLGELSRISISDIDQISYLSARDATTRFGTGHVGGVIQIRTRR